MLFSKKSKQPKKPVINLARLSEAVSIHDSTIFKMTYDGGKNYSFLMFPATTKITDKLSFKVNNFEFLSPYRFHPRGYMFLGNAFTLDLYADGIRMSSYKFFIEKENCFPQPTSPWNCIKKEVYHEMPEQFIADINKWSYDVLAQYRQEAEEKERRDQIQYEEEEQHLQMHR